MSFSILTAQKVLRLAAALEIPVYVTTQSKAKLGDTASELLPYLSAAPVVLDDDKTRFSMWTPAISAAFPPPRRSSSSSPSSSSAPASSSTAAAPATTTPSSDSEKTWVAIVGIETHICVTQTALALVAAGHGVYVLADGVSSCNREEVPLALARLRAEGARVVSSEGWLYEVMGDAAIPPFRSAAAVVKETSPQTKLVLASLLPHIQKAKEGRGGGERAKLVQ